MESVLAVTVAVRLVRVSTPKAQSGGLQERPQEGKCLSHPPRVRHIVLDFAQDLVDGILWSKYIRRTRQCPHSRFGGDPGFVEEDGRICLRAESPRAASCEQRARKLLRASAITLHASRRAAVTISIASRSAELRTSSRRHAPVHRPEQSRRPAAVGNVQ